MSSSTDRNTIARARGEWGIGAWLLMACEIVALGCIVAFSASVFAPLDALCIVLAMTVSYLVPRFIYSESRVACRAGQWLLLVVGALLAVYAILSIKMWTVDAGYTLEMPRLQSDDGGYYRWALHHYDGRCPEPNVSIKGLPLFMLWLWKVLGVSIVWPVALNYMFTMLAIVMTGKVAVRLLRGRVEGTSPAATAVLAMLMVATMGFFLSQGVRIQKEAACAFGFTTVGYVLAGMSTPGTLSKGERHRDWALFVLATLVVALVRTNFTYFIVIGAAMMAFACRRAHWKQGTAMAAVAMLMAVAFSLIFSYTFKHQLVTIDGGEAMARDFKMGLMQQPYHAIIGDFFFYPEWKRLLLLPVIGGVQYIIPFPWLYEGSDMSIFSVLPRVRLMWYVVGGVCLHYYLYITIVRYKQQNLGMWAWWPLVLFFAIAFITGGTVSRYILPIEPLFVVIAVYVLLQVRQGYYRRSFMVWMVVYTFILVAVLILCYQSQVEYLHNLDEYYRQRAAMGL